MDINFWSKKKILVEKIFGGNFFFLIFGRKICWLKKYFGKKILVKKIVGRRFFCQINFFVEKNFGRKKFLIKKNVRSKKFSWKISLFEKHLS